MKIETNDYVTMAEARDILAASERGFYRAIRRVGLEKTTIELWGIRLVKKSMLDAIDEAYYPVGSKRRAAAAKTWGATGGNAKAKKYSDKEKAS